VDDAEALQHLVDISYPRAETIVLIQDHLHTPIRAALYEAFPPEDARRLSDTLEGPYTPQHGSGLNRAAIALRVLRGQGLDRRIPVSNHRVLSV
jgi:hypothetical protein